MAELISRFSNFLAEKGVSIQVEGPLVEQIEGYGNGMGHDVLESHKPALIIGTDSNLSLVDYLKKRNDGKHVHVIESNIRRCNSAARKSTRYDGVYVYFGTYPNNTVSIINDTQYDLVAFKHGLNYVKEEELVPFVTTARANLTANGLFVASITGVRNADGRMNDMLKRQGIIDFDRQPFKGRFGGSTFFFGR